MSVSKSSVAVALSLPLLLVVLFLAMIGAQSRSSCTAALSGSGLQGATGAQVDGLTEAQLQLARNGVAIGKQRGEPESVILAELAAQATESTLRNLANPAVPESLNYSNDGLGHDGDSVGPHQMRVSVWGSVGIATLMNPVYQINWFYDQADLVPGRDRMAPANLAQAVEMAKINAYAGQLDLARDLYVKFADIDPASLSSARAGQPASGCGPNGAGMLLPGASSEFGAAIIAAAQKWIGTPYIWGGGDQNGPTDGGFDCSGLTLYALYQASGGRLRLPHFTQAQQDHPTAQVVPFDQRQPGDLIFFTARGDGTSHHVAIYYGRNEQGQDLVLHAPDRGQTVTIAPLWNGDRLDARRYSIPADTGTGQEGKSL
ncbi:C40 family peptidase [Nocardia tengchongensis]|uniref:C40 family peptidase n=1 Tax=Nocardia tengchongensis TaxID=2055889 RepID=UPI0036A4828F